MNAYESNATLDQIADVLNGAEHVLLTTHAKPDGDALGSVLALARALELAGKRVERWLMPPLMESLRVLTRDTPLHFHGEESDAPLPPCRDEPDRIVILDTGAWGQIEPMRAWIEPRRDRTIVIDHHLRGDDAWALRHIEPDAAAACEIVAELIDRMGVEYDPIIRDALFVGIATDTGWFRFSNTRPRTHDLAARLLAGGVDHAELYARLEQNERPEKLRLITRALQGMEYIAGGRAALLVLGARDFKETGARLEETERLVDLPQAVGAVRVVVLLTEMPDGRVRLSFRSKPGPDAVDVNQLARDFGGGGHARAAGARSDQPLGRVRDQVVEAVESALGAALAPQ